MLEIVQPLFRSRLQNEYTSKGLGSLQSFLSTQPVIHILFHLRHRYSKCCADKSNCFNNTKPPLINCQWNLLYTEKSGQRGHNCHCKFTANPVQLRELDITLAGLILLNCCNLGSTEENAVHTLRRYKNDYLSHNTEGGITETEYNSLWTKLTNFVLQLDPNKQDHIFRIENRPLDDGLCRRYTIDLLNIHKKLNEMDNSNQGISSSVHGIDSSIQGISSTVQGMDSSIQGISSTVQGMDSSIQGISSTVKEIDSSIQGIQELLLTYRNEAICKCCKKKLNEEGSLNQSDLEKDVKPGSAFQTGAAHDIYQRRHCLEETGEPISDQLIGVHSEVRTKGSEEVKSENGHSTIGDKMEETNKIGVGNELENSSNKVTQHQRKARNQYVNISVHSQKEGMDAVYSKPHDDKYEPEPFLLDESINPPTLFWESNTDDDKYEPPGNNQTVNANDGIPDSPTVSNIESKIKFYSKHGKGGN